MGKAEAKDEWGKDSGILLGIMELGNSEAAELWQEEVKGNTPIFSTSKQQKWASGKPHQNPVPFASFYTLLSWITKDK